jgi:Ser/Thr protein kinase RdoA (MazF antagonist)
MSPTFPTIASILAPQALIDDVLPGFGLTTVAGCHFHSGGFNHTYQVRAADGATFYLRVYRRTWRTLADIQYELDVLNHLRRKAFPAARPLPYRDGRYFRAVAAPEGERYVVVFSEAPGTEISYDSAPMETARRYGTAVAAMHNALEDFQSPHDRFRKDLAHFTERPLPHIAPFLADRPDAWAAVTQFAARLRQRILDLPAARLEQGVCHGDLQGYHANVDGEGTLTFFDFDCGGFGYRAYDLAVFLWCCRLEDAVDTRWAPFLAAYRQERAIAAVDVDAVGLFVCARYLWHMGVHTQNAADWGAAFLNDKYFSEHLNRLRQAEADYLS